MPPFLSAEWFDELKRVLGSVVVGNESRPALFLGQVVTGGPTGTVQYTAVLGGGRPGEVILNTVEDASVTLVEDYESAQSIVEGAPVAHLLSSGRIKVRGDLNALLASSDELLAFGLALAEAGAA
jgi:hypothetical protein